MPMDSSTHFFKTACVFEASLIVVALLLAWIADIDPFATLYFSEPDFAIGIVATLPLMLLFVSMDYLPQKSFVDIKDLLLRTLAPSLHKRHWTDLLLLAIIAGVSEELLFRGVIQPWITVSWGVTAGLYVSNLIFGLVHAVTPLYTVLAIVMGLYLSTSMELGSGESNLLIPIIIHSLYDFFAFVMLMRLYRASLPAQE
jgi:uncharacterized protein